MTPFRWHPWTVETLRVLRAGRCSKMLDSIHKCKRKTRTLLHYYDSNGQERYTFRCIKHPIGKEVKE